MPKYDEMDIAITAIKAILDRFDRQVTLDRDDFTREILDPFLSDLADVEGRMDRGEF